MDEFTLTQEACIKIIEHMNKDHLDALRKYAAKYLNIHSSDQILMLSINSKLMKLLVDGQEYDINFEHELTSRKDAHSTLVEMSK